MLLAPTDGCNGQPASQVNVLIALGTQAVPTAGPLQPVLRALVLARTSRGRLSR
jgi:hypothetical protein